MIESTTIEIEVPASVKNFKLPKGVDKRLQDLLDRQDQGERLTRFEKNEAEGLVDLAEMLTLLRLRSQRVKRESLK